jgi:osmotically-inducible protein OsmY
MTRKTLTSLTLRRTSMAAALLAALIGSGCAPLVVGGAMMSGAMVATDRRTSGTQLEDEGIEYKINARLKENLGTLAHINVNSYNRTVLLTGEVANETDRATAERLASQTDTVQRVLNELAVGPASALSGRSSDLLVASKMKASLVDAQDLISNAFYVVVERGNVYIMGRVTEREAARAVGIAQGIKGVQKVVRAFDIITEEELARVTPKPATKPAP